MAIALLIVDDHPSFRATARELLEAEGFDVVGEAEDGHRPSQRSTSFIRTSCCSTFSCPT